MRRQRELGTRSHTDTLGNFKAESPAESLARYVRARELAARKVQPDPKKSYIRWFIWKPASKIYSFGLEYQFDRQLKSTGKANYLSTEVPQAYQNLKLEYFSATASHSIRRLDQKGSGKNQVKGKFNQTWGQSHPLPTLEFFDGPRYVFPKYDRYPNFDEKNKVYELRNLTEDAEKERRSREKERRKRLSSDEAADADTELEYLFRSKEREDSVTEMYVKPVAGRSDIFPSLSQPQIDEVLEIGRIMLAKLPRRRFNSATTEWKDHNEGVAPAGGSALEWGIPTEVYKEYEWKGQEEDSDSGSSSKSSDSESDSSFLSLSLEQDAEVLGGSTMEGLTI